MLRNPTIPVLLCTIIGIICEQMSTSYHFHRLEGYIIQSTDPAKVIHKATSKFQCAQMCSVNDCEYFTYKSSERQCQYFHIWQDNVTIQKTTNRQAETFVSKNVLQKKWFKIYSLTMEKDCLVSESFLENPRLINPPNSCSHLNETFFYRNTLMDQWTILPIDQVKFAAYKNGIEELELVFNGRNSTKSDWFNFQRLISSPWTDLSEATIAYFGISPTRQRHFYVSQVQIGCERLLSWLIVSEAARCS
ncbi:uncharacterized protein LOC118766143 [Octopus sinensis]|nr:uncharacterized protein LOC118766143 [Octopus sinensis]